MKVWVRALDGEYLQTDRLRVAHVEGEGYYIRAWLTGVSASYFGYVHPDSFAQYYPNEFIAGPFADRHDAQDWLDDYFRREIQGKDIMLIKGSPR